MRRMRRMGPLALLVVLALALVPATAIAAGPGGFAGGGGMGGGTGGGANTSTNDHSYTSQTGALQADGTAVTSTNASYSTSTADQNAALVKNGGTLTISGDTFTKAGDDTDGDNCNFYGINSILLGVGSSSTAYISGSNLSATSQGSNGIFSTSGAKVYAYNDTISTTSSNSRGLDATYGGYIIGDSLSITTLADHCASIASDRGGGYISVTNSTLSTAGSGSPLIYSTGDLEVSGCTGTATGSQIAGMEGLNDILIYNSQLSSTNDHTSGSDPIKDGVILYQSISGDADTSTSSAARFDAYGSTLSTTITSGAFFYCTNTTANVVLSATTLSYDSSSVNLIEVEGNSNNWGSTGSNGATVNFTGIGETLAGNAVVDSISTLNMYLLDGTSWSGASSLTTNSAGSTSSAPLTVDIDANSTWVVTGNSTVTNLNVISGGSVVDASGNAVSIVNASGTTLRSGTSSYTVTVKGSYGTSFSTSDGNALRTSLIDRSAFDTAFGTSTTISANVDFVDAKVTTSGMTRDYVSGATFSTLGPTIAVYTTKSLAENTDYTVSFTSSDGTTYARTDAIPEASATYSVTITGAGDYDGQGSIAAGTFTVYDATSLVAEGTAYHVVSSASPSGTDYVLDAAGTSPVLGANVSVWTDNGGANQAFTFSQQADGNYVIANCANTALVLDAAGACPYSGCNVSAWTANGGVNQEWVLEPTGNGGEFVIASAYDTGIVLDAAGSVPKVGANVSVWTSNGGTNQKWTLVDSNDITSAQVAMSGATKNYVAGATFSTLGPTVTVTLLGNTLAENTDYTVSFTSSDGTTYARTDAIPEASATYSVTITGAGDYDGQGSIAAGTFTVYDATSLVATGTAYHVVSSASPSGTDYVLDAAGASPVLGANVSVWTDNGGANQAFTFTQLADGNYVIANCANTALVLDAAGACPYSGCNVSAWTANGGVNQEWVLEPTGNGGEFVIASAYDTGIVLDAAGSVPKVGANVSVWTSNGGTNQKWTVAEFSASTATTAADATAADDATVEDVATTTDAATADDAATTTADAATATDAATTTDAAAAATTGSATVADTTVADPSTDATTADPADASDADIVVVTGESDTATTLAAEQAAAESTSTVMFIVAGGTSSAAAMETTDAAQSVLSMLPLTLSAVTTESGDIALALPETVAVAGDASTDIVTGDIVLSDKNLVICLSTAPTVSGIRIGHINDVSELSTLVSTAGAAGELSVTLALIG